VALVPRPPAMKGRCPFTDDAAHVGPLDHALHLPTPA
jgi:hypothetical protein